MSDNSTPEEYLEEEYLETIRNLYRARHGAIKFGIRRSFVRHYVKKYRTLCPKGGKK